MWQRFTEKARKVVFFAQEEAGRLGENYVSTEHLLLGLIREDDNVAARILDRIGVKLGRIRSDIEREVAHGDGRIGQDMQLTPRAKRVIDLAYDEAVQLDNNYIGTEHLLLGLVREGDGLAGRVLTKLGVNLERTRSEVKLMQDGGGTGNSKKTVPSEPASQSGNIEIALEWWQKLTAPASRALAYALVSAPRRLGVNEISTEHLLLGLVQEKENLAVRALEAMDVDLQYLVTEIGADPGEPKALGPAQLMTGMMRVLAFAELSANALSSQHIGTHHLLLGVVGVEDSLAGRVFSSFNVDLARTREAVKKLQSEDGEPLE